MGVTEWRCGTCKWLRVAPDKTGRRVVLDTNVYLCTFEPVWPPLPDSITSRFWLKFPTAGYMRPDQGAQCPMWEEFEK